MAEFPALRICRRCDVDAVDAGRQLRNIDFNFDALFCSQNFGSPDFLGLCIDDIRVRRFRRALPQNSGSAEQCGGE